MEIDASRIFYGLLFLVIGIALFAGAIMARLEMEKEVKGGRRIVWNSYFPYFNSNDFSDKGNRFRKIYNIFYFVLIVYSLVLITFMKTGG
jgi:hypothetical protein